jgi:hypothetical protein
MVDDAGDYVGDSTRDAGVVTSVVQATVAPTPAVFGSQAAGTTGAPVVVTITNNHPTFPLVIASLGLNGDFAVVGGTCNPSGTTTLPGGGTCTVDVAFTPTDLGTRTGFLSVTYGVPAGMDPDDAPPAQKVDLLGTGSSS